MTDMTTTMQRVDEAVRKLHEAREGHPCEGDWTERNYQGDTMTPREFIPTCCDKR